MTPHAEGEGRRLRAPSCWLNLLGFPSWLRKPSRELQLLLATFQGISSFFHYFISGYASGAIFFSLFKNSLNCSLPNTQLHISYQLILEQWNSVWFTTRQLGPVEQLWLHEGRKAKTSFLSLFMLLVFPERECFPKSTAKIQRHNSITCPGTCLPPLCLTLYQMKGGWGMVNKKDTVFTSENLEFKEECRQELILIQCICSLIEKYKLLYHYTEGTVLDNQGRLLWGINTKTETWRRYRN